MFFSFNDFAKMQRKEALNVIVQKKITLADIWKQNKITIEYDCRKECKKCDGKGTLVENPKKKECKSCDGKGIQIHFIHLPIGKLQTQGPCEKCKGEGKTISTKDLCEDCNGEKLRMKKTKLEITLPKNFHSNHFVCENKGHVDESGTRGNCVIVFELDTSPFKQEGADLIFNKEITLTEALFGHKFSITIPALPEDEELEIENKQIITPETITTIKDHGLFEDDFHRGSIIIKYKILFPKSIKEVSLENLTNIVKDAFEF
jgi:DnaJ-class molecular chaperone